VFNVTTHAGRRNTTSTKDLDGIAGSVLSTSRGVALQKGNLACKLGSLLFVGHVAHLEGDVLQPSLNTYDEELECKVSRTNEGTYSRYEQSYQPTSIE
jgi:hypothetical protein